jgi:hypothetical protein
MREVHTIVAVRLKPRMTILLKNAACFSQCQLRAKTDGPTAKLRAFVNSFHSATAYETAWRAPHFEGAAIHLTQPDRTAPVCVPFHNFCGSSHFADNSARPCCDVGSRHFSEVAGQASDIGILGQTGH